MLFPTVTFALFLAIVLPIAWYLAPRPGQPASQAVGWKLFLVAASYVFYGAWDWRFVPLLMLSTVGNEVAAMGIHLARDRAARDRWLAGALVGNLGVLVWFKYAGFLAGSTDGLLRLLGFEVDLPYPEVVLPVGISFFTFQAISYVVDVHRGQLRPTHLLDVAVYLAFFPQLVAGPIVRANEFLPQLAVGPDPRGIPVGRALRLIGVGLVLKVVVANHLAVELVDPLFATPGRYGGGQTLLGIYAYAVQIYADFAGYTSIAIGVALLLGFEFPANFDRPYAARSLQEFWRRWHMTLSRWLRDYLYIPLGGSAGGARRTQRNLLLTMLLGGLWHGAAWTFLVWGGLHGLGLVVERRRQARVEAATTHGDPAPASASEGRAHLVSSGSAPRPLHPATSWLITFHLVCLGWVFFRAPSFGVAWSVLGGLLSGRSEVPLSTTVLPLVVVVLLAQQVGDRPRAWLRRSWDALPVALHVTTFALVLVALDVFGPDGVAPFIYFQF
ncbi:MAG: MBOAT family protein [Nitriliruptor sp.]|nr:MAG: MBOAT family protein [Nitriliruptor sp.]